jgi:ABC-type transporter Mla MlaB component
MLRISSIAVQPDAITLKLEGKLLEAWCGELRSACQLAREQVSLVTLDLMDVSFIDAAGLDLLRTLLRRGITISRRSRFVAELLHGLEGLETATESERP